MSDVLAHAGGLDEIILGGGLVMLYLLFRSSRAERGGNEPTEGPCLYCGHQLGPEVQRCPGCGFRARRGRAGATPSPGA